MSNKTQVVASPKTNEIVAGGDSATFQTFSGGKNDVKMTSSSRASDWDQPWLEWWLEMGDLVRSRSWVGLTLFGFSSLPLFSSLFSFFSHSLSIYKGVGYYNILHQGQKNSKG